jgi:hypothetical protein
MGPEILMSYKPLRDVGYLKNNPLRIKVPNNQHTRTLDKICTFKSFEIYS